jgi:hypothetical protein
VIPTQSLQPTASQAGVVASADTNKEHQALYNQSRQENKEFTSGLQSAYAKNKALQIKMQAELDKAEAVDLYAGFNDEATSGLNGLLALKGKDAVTGLQLEKLQMNVNKLGERYLSSASAGAKKFLTPKISIKKDTVNSLATSHTMRESRAYIKETDKKDIDLHKENAIEAITGFQEDPAYSVANFEKFSMAAKESKKRELQQSGVSLNSDNAKKEIKNIDDEIYHGAISKFIENNDFDSGKEMLGIAKEKGLLHEQQIKQFEKTLGYGSAQEKAVGYAGSAMQEATAGFDTLGFNGLRQLPSFSTIEGKIKEKTNDPLETSLAIAQARKQYNEMVKAGDKIHQDHATKVTNDVLDGRVAFADLSALDRSKLTETELSRLKDGHFRLTNENVLSHLLQNQTEVLPANIGKWRLYLSDADFAAQKSFGERLAKRENGLKEATYSHKIVFAELAKVLNKGGKFSETETIRYSGAIQERVDNFNSVHKRPPNHDESKRIAAEVANDKVGLYNRVMFDEVEPYARLSSDQLERAYVEFSGVSNSKYKHGARIFLRDIPEDFRRKVIARYRAKGIIPSQQQLADTYAEAVGRRR